MIPRFALAGSLVATAGAVALTLAAPATATPGAPLTSLTIKGPGGVTTLECDPVGGTHPAATAACAELDAARGMIRAIPPRNVVCSTEYSPTPISASGTYRGRTVSFSAVAGNPCDARRSHGHVFAF